MKIVVQWILRVGEIDFSGLWNCGFVERCEWDGIEEEKTRKQDWIAIFTSMETADKTGWAYKDYLYKEMSLKREDWDIIEDRHERNRKIG